MSLIKDDIYLHDMMENVRNTFQKYPFVFEPMNAINHNFGAIGWQWLPCASQQARQGTKREYKENVLPNGMLVRIRQSAWGLK